MLACSGQRGGGDLLLLEDLHWKGQEAAPAFETEVALSSLGTCFLCGAWLLAWLFEVKNTIMFATMSKVLFSEPQVPLS